MDPLPDLGSIDDNDLRELIDRYVKEENEVSYRRRLLHGYIDILKSELLARKKTQYTEGSSALDNIDIDGLSRILSGKGLPDDHDDSKA